MDKSDPVGLPPRRRCPICGKPPQQKFYPFCSVRCSDIDLSRWLGGKYAIPTEEAEESEEDSGGDSKKTQ